MLYFSGTTTSVVSGPALFQQRGEHNNFNLISQHLHPDHKKLFDERLGTDRSFFADLLASLITQYHITMHLDRKELMRNCLDAVSENMHNLGAEEIPRMEAVSNIGSHAHIKFMVFGYQDPRGLMRRVDAVAKVIAELGKRCDVMFVGAYSGAMGTQIPSETRKMIALFEDCMRNYAIKPDSVNISTEDSSLNTVENIERAIAKHYIAEKRANETQSVILVSSSFHLIRITEAFRNFLLPQKESDEKSQAARDFVRKNVDRLFWVGAENRDFVLHGRDKTYVKNMLFDVLRKNIQ